jgi:hypothetical protein
MQDFDRCRATWWQARVRSGWSSRGGLILVFMAVVGFEGSEVIRFGGWRLEVGRFAEEIQPQQVTQMRRRAVRFLAWAEHRVPFICPSLREIGVIVTRWRAFFSGIFTEWVLMSGHPAGSVGGGVELVSAGADEPGLRATPDVARAFWSAVRRTAFDSLSMAVGAFDRCPRVRPCHKAAGTAALQKQAHGERIHGTTTR